MKMTLQAWMLAILTSSVAIVYSQDKDSLFPRQNKYSIAVFAGGLGYDAGIGAEVGSPAFSNNRFCVRLKGNLHWLEQFKAAHNHWVKYRSVAASFVYRFISIDRCRMFVEAGPFLILPDKRFSKKNSYQGLTASAGLEMFVLNSSSVNMCYYFCVGVAHSDAIAETLESQMRYGNGFVFSNGFRCYF
jgi:hypothetical protein